MNINKELRYKLAPQMKVYDSLGYRFLPYIMFTQPPNFRSEVLNTDERGFRFNSKVKKKSIFDEIKKNETILFLGEGIPPRLVCLLQDLLPLGK